VSAASPECVRCQVYRTEVALLRAEIAGLNAAVLDLTRTAPEDAPVLEIVAVDQPACLRFAGPYVEGSDRIYQVSLTYREQLSAASAVAALEPSGLALFFEDLARSKDGWVGEKKVESPEGQLALSCTYDGSLYRPEVAMQVALALDILSFEPYWTVQIRLDLDPESLPELAQRAREFFGYPGSHAAL